jgi:uncharacterized protein
LLFSTKTASAIAVASDLIQDIESDRLSGEEKEALTSLGLLVESHEQETREMLGFVQELNEINRSSKYVLILNLDCNLACTYCFEGTRKGKHYLSDETADRFVAFVKGGDYSNKDEIYVTFYGGEPLLSLGRIISIAGRLRAFCEQKGLRFGFSLVTNGVLLTPAAVRQLTPLGLESAKLTLDGPKEVHDSFRPFRSGDGSFDVILRNIEDVCDLVRVQLGGNFTRDRYREFPRLLDELGRRGLGPDAISLIKFDPVISETSEFAPPDFNDGCASGNESWVADASLFLREEVLRRGYKTQKIMPSPCLLQLADTAVVNYDGSLYKCPGLIGREHCRVGDLKNGLTDYRASHALDAWKNDECLACAYLPLCFGGCKYLKLVQDGGFGGVLCRKPLFDRTLAEFVRQDIKYNV